MRLLPRPIQSIDTSRLWILAAFCSMRSLFIGAVGKIARSAGLMIVEYGMVVWYSSIASIC